MSQLYLWYPLGYKPLKKFNQPVRGFIGRLGFPLKYTRFFYLAFVANDVKITMGYASFACDEYPSYEAIRKICNKYCHNDVQIKIVTLFEFKSEKDFLSFRKTEDNLHISGMFGFGPKASIVSSKD